MQTRNVAVEHSVRFVMGHRDLVVSADGHDHRLYIDCASPRRGESEDDWLNVFVDIARPSRPLEHAIRECLAAKEAKQLIRRVGRIINHDDPTSVVSVLRDAVPYIPLLIQGERQAGCG